MRVKSLDALRGLAAVCVVISHWVSTFAAGWGVALAQRSMLWMITWHLGADAVLVFFALSGFVLAVSLKETPQTYWQFIAKRVLRLYPPFLFAIALSVAFFEMVQPKSIAGFSAWFNSQWVEPPTPAIIAGHVAMVGTIHFERLDPSIWSLIYEMRLSILFPLIALSVRNALWPSLGLSLLAAMLAVHLAWSLSPLMADWLMTVQYLPLFFWGAALGQHRVAAVNWVRNASARFRALLWAVEIVLLFSSVSIFGGVLTNLGAIGLVALCFADPTGAKLLGHNVLQYFGKISYSLYLVHLPVLLMVMHLFYDKLSLWLLVPAGIAATLLISDLTNRLIELPTQKSSHRLFFGVAGCERRNLA